MEFPVTGTSFEDMANLLHKEVLLNKFTPPVVVAHSLSTFVAQKYLESFALSGLVLVNPIPPTAHQTLAKLSMQWSNSLSHAEKVVSVKNNVTLTGIQLKYYGVCMETEGATSSSNVCASQHLQTSFMHSSLTAQPFFSTGRLLQNYLENSCHDDTTVNLERGTVCLCHTYKCALLVAYVPSASSPYGVYNFLRTHRCGADFGSNHRRRPQRSHSRRDGRAAAAACGVPGRRTAFQHAQQSAHGYKRQGVQ